MVYISLWAITLASIFLPATLAAPTAPLAPLHRVAKRAESGGYIVKFKPNAVKKANRRKWIDNQLRKAKLAPLTTEQTESLKIGWREDVFDGFAGKITEDALNVLRASGDVEYVSEDAEARITALTQQTDATWGLRRISQQLPLPGGSRDLDRTFTYDFDDSAGRGVDIYILDTGVDVTHPQFGGRAQFLESFGTGVPGRDIHGHGTHVAGIAGSESFGVAKNANIFAVKVMSDSGRGDSSNIIAGINFAVTRAVQGTQTRPSVINISIIASASTALDNAVANAAALGIHVVVGAGNDNEDAGRSSPARSPAAITVGAIDITDTKSIFSNFGQVVDIFAPGTNIPSTFTGGGTRVMSGTSMATPYISGLVAYLIALEGQKTPVEMLARIQGLSSPNRITSLPNGTINEVAWNGATVASDTPTAPPAVPPAAPAPGNRFTDAQRQKVLGSVSGLLDSLQALANAAVRADD